MTKERDQNAEATPAIGLIGLGGYGQVHLRLLRDRAAAGECRFVSAVAVKGTSETDLASLPKGVRLYETFAAWLKAEDGRFDLCCLPTPIHLHAAMTLAVLAKERSVLVEKPLAASWPEVSELVAAKPAPGRFLAVGFHDLYTNEVHQLKRELLEGKHGRIRRVKLLGLWPRPDSYYQRNAWAGHLKVTDGAVLDSPLNNAFAHYLLLALFFAGETPAGAAVVARGEAELYRTRQIESFDTAAIRLRTRTDVEILAAVTHSGAAQEDPLIVIETDRRRIEWRAGKEVRVFADSKEVARRDLPDAVRARKEMYTSLFRLVRGETAWMCSAPLAAVHAACILDLHAACPIHDLPGELLCSREMAGEPGLGMVGIDAALQQVIDEGKMPSELGLSWTSAATPFAGVYSARLAEQVAGLSRAQP